ncbi:hypothetical protein ABZ468_33920 [Streptomyces sp. NPDC005708]|uniref:hypothetical protein n=1 Tax=Streptomyces sp. NPDC005708 TaxID=3154564 RepID=UPI00340E0F9B
MTTFDLVWKSATEKICAGDDFYAPPYAGHARVPGDSAASVVSPLDISPCQGKIGITPFGHAA